MYGRQARNVGCSKVRARGIQSRLCGGLLWGLAWLFVAPRVSAQAGCVEIEGALPEALSECVTEVRLCSSYLRALAADGGGGDRQDTADDFLPLRVRLRAAPGQSADASAIELDAAAYGVTLGQRTLSIRARDCAAVPDVLALVLALLARQASSDSQLRAARNAARAQPAAVVEQAPAEQLGPPPEQRTPSISGSVGLGAGVGMFFGALPSAAPALQLQAATPIGDPLTLRARATLLWPQQQRIAEGSVNLQHYELALEACAGFSFRDTRLSLRLCGGPRVGLMIVHARDFTLQNERATEFLMYLGVQPELGLALGPRTSLNLGVAIAAAVVRPRFGVALDSGTRVSTLSTPSTIRAELALTLVRIF